MLTAGSRLGPYEIGAPLGAGGMGEVYRATDTHLGRGVAIKVLPDTLAHDVERVARLEHEARMLATLSHPNIAVIYGLEKSAGVHALVMDSLDCEVARGVEGRFSPDGRWVAFVSNDSGRYEVYLRALAPDVRGASAGVGEPIPVSRDGGTRPRWREDGRELFYLDPMRNMMSVEITPGATLQVGEPKRMFQLPVGTASSDTSGDGRTVAVVPLEQAAQAPFSILLNWQAALKP